eukprot:TRINITY_DN11901_c0_g1_i10.p1 TRINITY_DN11901_c0_g1~~TRINITY_DN11901_c0_g1_i10.p1  ORF type:complete len:110 (+),score=0.15 TRINITY_DN11901_c0_g1_i10:235-564(+)
MRSLPSVGGIKAQKSRSSLFSSFDLQKPDKDEPSVLAAGPVGRALSSPSSDRMSPGLVHAHPDLIYEDSRLVSGTLVCEGPQQHTGMHTHRHTETCVVYVWFWTEPVEV